MNPLLKMLSFLKRKFCKAAAKATAPLGIDLRYTAKICGHRFLPEVKLQQPDGEFIKWKLPDGIEWCPECVNKMTILCAWCSKPIVVGDPITLYTPNPPDKEMPEHAVKYEEPGREFPAYVGCGRMSCADTGADYSGTWLPDENGKGAVARRPSMIETLLANPGMGAICHDMDSPNPSVKLFPVN